MAELQEPDIIDQTIPKSSGVIVIVGIIILVSGAFFVYYPPAVSISAGLGVFALGLALISYGLTQYNNYRARLTTIENSKRLARIEEMIEGLSKK
jgi:uncharacterized membrane protein